MSEGFAILCPGQGGQHAAMFDLLRNDASGAEILQGYALEQRLGHPLDAVLQDDALLFANRHAQPLVVAAGLAAWQVLRSALPAPDLVAGYSIGELTAYGVADSLPPFVAIDLAIARAGNMDACLHDEPQQGLMSVSGLPVAEAAAILQQHHAYVAIQTGFDTLIAGGRSADLQAAGRQCEGAGARTSSLPVGIASHTPLMASALAPFSTALDGADFHDPAIPVLAGISAQEIRNKDAARHCLLQQLTTTILWSACMDACAERGITVALELGPGSALSRMLRERQPHIECRSLADFRSLAGARKWLESRIG
ncbi:ACP S-malonyltransferase [Herbaspirillum rhizosphaerae]|uniref:ACP S-malonyltransferase n=1 Tax=Herbaspirillum rhizosphaerae TaxID=346179 RepID=UPI00067E5CAC|nr:acyltransferase domain-containing protein [Herbaspirillum rhizosphaerae]